MQEQNRAKVLAAARAEFVERGFRDAKIDVIAERAALTRGAVYSNFPGKRALYFAVLAQDADAGDVATRDAVARDVVVGDAVAGATHSAAGEVAARDAVAWDGAAREAVARATHLGVARTPREALVAFARSWLAQLPLATDEGPSRLAAELLPVVRADDLTRRPFAQLTQLTALLLGLALERLQPERTFRPRMVRAAEAALTLLYGASQLAAAAPGFVDEMVVVDACAQLADADFADRWAPPHLDYVAPARPVDRPWRSPYPAHAGDDVLVVLGLHRLAALEEAVRAAPRGVGVTAALVTGEPAELASLARFVLADASRHLRAAFPPSARPAVRIVHDDTGAVAAAAGVTAVSDATETAVRIRDGRIVAQADGPGAPHAAASA
jgi:AcrR family transcriptional regulator